VPPAMVVRTHVRSHPSGSSRSPTGPLAHSTRDSRFRALRVTLPAANARRAASMVLRGFTHTPPPRSGVPPSLCCYLSEYVTVTRTVCRVVDGPEAYNINNNGVPKQPGVPPALPPAQGGGGARDGAVCPGASRWSSLSPCSEAPPRRAARPQAASSCSGWSSRTASRRPPPTRARAASNLCRTRSASPNETENLGMAILSQLGTQRGQIESAIERRQQAHEGLSTSNRLIRQMRGVPARRPPRGAWSAAAS
jgi:hypothetical protein